MNRFRLVALLPWVAAAGCYNDAPAQSTLPERHYMAGPPGGAMDPRNAYSQVPDGAAPGGIADDADASEPAQPAESGSAAVVVAPDPGDARPDPEPGDPSDAVAEAPAP